MGWGPLIQMLLSSKNTSQKHPRVRDRIFEYCGLAKLTHRINHHNKVLPLKRDGFIEKLNSMTFCYFLVSDLY